MRLVGKREQNGFLLKNEFNVEAPLTVLTGKNGSGKTRFLESLRSGGGTDIFSDNHMEASDVVYIAHQGLSPSVSRPVNEEEAGRNLKSLIWQFGKRKAEFDDPSGGVDEAMSLLSSSTSGPRFSEIHRIVRAIASHLGKKPSELRESELSSYYQGYDAEMFGVKNLSSIFTRYKVRLDENSRAQWLAAKTGEDVFFIADEDIEKVFGREPWAVLNEILELSFSGKIKVNVPSEMDERGEYVTFFYLQEDGSPITVANFSTGERTLLWLALVLFYTQFPSVHSVPPPRLILLDEPDAFLHPSMVVKLIGFLDFFARKFSTKVIITTHSPTTVALAPDGSIYLVDGGFISPLEKDMAIACLLDGVSQVSISPYNRRQVFVESSTDADIYQAIYGKLAHRSDLLDTKITLAFVSSGPKMPKDQVKEKLLQVFGKDLCEIKVDDFLKSVNGVGCCSQVEGMVFELMREGSDTVRGVIDWDLKNAPGVGVAVLGWKQVYSIENIALDPVCIMLKLHFTDSAKYAISVFCGSDVSWDVWISDAELLQRSLDWYILEVLGRGSSRDVELLYVSGLMLHTDGAYLLSNGHELAAKILAKFVELMPATKGKSDRLMPLIVNEVMITMTNGRLIPSLFGKVFSEIQEKLDN